jgi:glycosyltransferase involved in cell wall biosynthesis
VLTGGRLVHWKGQDLLIEGLAVLARRAPDIDARLTVTGSGPYRPVLEALGREHQLTGRLEFVGHLPTREDVFDLMNEQDLYALPTLRDGPPVALLEAMAFGLPVLCLDLGATAELVPDQAGIRISPDSRSAIVAQIADALEWVANNPSDASKMGERARAYALERHDWRRIREVIERSYEDVRPPAVDPAR